MGKGSEHLVKGLPADLVYEILIRLPVKLLTRLRCVCKQWNSLISHPPFQQDHYCHNAQRAPLLVLTSSKFNKVHCRKIHILTYNNTMWTLVNHYSKSDPWQQNYTDILSCQGLVCIRGGIRDKHITLCNPSTGQMMVLPPTYGDTDNIGFGYAPSKKEFKVVRFFRPNDFSRSETNSACDIFTLGTSEWREVKLPHIRYGFLRSGSPFLHGAIHLLPNNRDSLDFINGIVKFDIQSEQYTTKKIRLPECCHVAPLSLSFPNMYLSEIGGSLCLNINLRPTLELWLLKDYNSGDWVNEYTIDLTSLGNFARGLASVILGDGTILLDVYTDYKNSLYCYHPRRKTFKLRGTGKYSAALYVESIYALGNST